MLKSVAGYSIFICQIEGNLLTAFAAMTTLIFANCLMSRGEPNVLFLSLAIPMTGGRRDFGDAQVYLASFGDHSNNT